MSFGDFRHIGGKGNGGRQDRLLRAAISAFVSLTRPSRREIAQIEDLALPLLDCVSPDTRRFVAAALCRCTEVPAALVQRLAREPVEVAAPLLLRSKALSDANLLALICERGQGHARIIARRPNLSAPILSAIEALSSETPQVSTEQEKQEKQHTASVLRVTRGDRGEEQPKPQGEAGTAAENVRAQLRRIAAGERAAPPLSPEGDIAFFDRTEGRRHYERLKASAFSDEPLHFQTALAEALSLDLQKARSLTETRSYSYLMVAFRALGLDEAQAFLLVATLFPSAFNNMEAIKLFIRRYHLIDRDAAVDQVGYWKVDILSEKPDAKRPEVETQANANSYVADPQPLTVRK